MNRIPLSALTLLLLSSTACSDADTIDDDGAGGSSATGGASSGGTNSGVGGTAVTSAGGTATGTGGRTISGGSGGLESSGGTGTGGEIGSGGTGGATDSDTGGSSSGGAVAAVGGTTGGGKPAVDPSAGCGKADPPEGSSGVPMSIGANEYYVKLPSDYDPDAAYVLLFMFNPTGNPIDWAEQNAGFEQTDAKDEAIRVYPHASNSGSGWGPSDVPFFEKIYAEMTDNYCVDKARVFSAGESSGGDYSSIIGCEHGDLLTAIGPGATKNVNQYPLDVGNRECKGSVGAVVIHGKNDNVVGPENGPKTRDFYAELNECGADSTPVEGYTDTLSNCVEFADCREGAPVFWCQHTDPNYGNTNHGWPAFAGKMLWEHFSAY